MKEIFSQLRQTALLMVGQSSYDAYLTHVRAHHPDREPMTQIEFFRDRERARYGSGGGRCC
jgi:uncharacterized short protein YbdD (DUF466 family)